MEVTSALQRFFTENFILLKNFERKKKLLKNKRQQMITRLLGMEKLATKFFKMHNVDKKKIDNVWKSSILKPLWLNFMEVISLNSILVTT